MDLPKDREEKLKQLMGIFLEENRKLNLSALRDEENCWVGNVLDSLPFVDLQDTLAYQAGMAVLDIGTGGGFPLLPLAICLPELRFTGLDATQKKIDAIARIVSKCSAANVTDLLCGRTEELGSSFTEEFDIVTARAVAPLNVLLEYAAPFTKLSGHIVLWKSMHIEQELADSLAARSELSCRLIHTHVYELPGDWGKRQLLVFQKTNPTPKAYPRAVGVAKKQPIV